MMVYARYSPYNSKVQAVYDALDKIYKSMGIDYEIRIQDSKNYDCKMITIIYDTADVMNFIESCVSNGLGRKPAPLPSRDELLKELDQGMTKMELAAKYGVSRPTLYKRLKSDKKK